MSVFRYKAGATITVSNHANLKAAWRDYKGFFTLPLIETFRCEAKLTDAQMRRLPQDLKDRLVHGAS